MPSRTIGAGVAAFAVVAAVFGHIQPLRAQPTFPLEACDGGTFSTEEDFVMERGEPFDGNPYVSDGDLLSTPGQVCARNADLLRVYDVQPDLGLDAVEAVRGMPPDKLADGGLQQLLKELNIDLWFSIEGTAEGRGGCCSRTVTFSPPAA